MKYDPIMCMMVPDSVKTEDASWKAWSLYIDGKFVKSFNSEMPPIKEAKEYMKENYPDKVAKLSRNTGSSSGYVISSRDSKTIDHAIRSCDEQIRLVKTISKKNGYAIHIVEGGYGERIVLTFPNESYANPHMWLGSNNSSNIQKAKELLDEFSK